MTGLPDYLAQSLKVLFVGYNPGERSAALQHHYAGRGNQFWRLLHEAGLTSRLYLPEEDNLLLLEGYGLTNLVTRPSKSSSDLTAVEMRSGAVQLRQKLAQYSPDIVCFLGKEVYRQYAGLKSGTPVLYGPITGKGLFPKPLEFVVPNPSGRSTIPYAEKLAAFRELRDLVF